MLYFHYVASCSVVIFFFKDTATPEIYTYLHTLSLHDALPIWPTPAPCRSMISSALLRMSRSCSSETKPISISPRSEEHTSELQSLMRISYAVFCLKKKTKIKDNVRQAKTKTSHPAQLYKSTQTNRTHTNHTDNSPYSTT